MLAVNKTKLAIKLLFEAIKNYFSSAEVFYIVENADWSIKHDGQSITNNLVGMKSRVTITHIGIRNSIVHYGSINTFITTKKIKKAHTSNKVIVTWFHVTPEDSRINRLFEADNLVDIWHTSCSMTKDKLQKLGIKGEKIRMIPLGVDLESFYPSPDKRIKCEELCLGSFQKDGEGWEEGLVPKLIKGPDLLLEVVKEIKTSYDVFMYLTGPARGYIKCGLEKENIKFKHSFLEHPNDVASYYRKIDYYLITSREEGGPKSVLESLACGIPLLTRRVGMVPDVIEHGINGFIVDDKKDYIEIINYLEKNPDKKNEIIIRGLKTVQEYSWGSIAMRYKKEMYKLL